MKETEILNLLLQQKKYFADGNTLSVPARLQALRSLKEVLLKYESEIYEALRMDLGKSESESYMCELGMVLNELSYMLRHTRKFARKKQVATPLSQAVSHSYVQPSPRGNVLIISPWNYPFMLTLDPLIDAVAAGNTAILKPSAYAPFTSIVIEKVIKEAFHPGHVSVVTGGRAENQMLLDQEFDYIFFTGSQAVGKEVLRHAAARLTPVALELGGKSPCIVDRTADIALAARRIVFGKFLNCGQTCVAPDYICCDKDVREDLEKALIREIRKQFGEHPLENPDYGKIINEKHFLRLSALLDSDTVLHGGKISPETLKIEPSVLSPCTWDSEIMKDEIFGPLLPILTYDRLDDALKEIQSRPHPLAFYLFSSDKKAIRFVTETCSFGGGCINDTIIHLATSNMGFGGVGNSGMGAYHGKTGFDAFSHHKSIVNKKTWLDLPMRYQPYTTFYSRLVKLFLR